MGGGALFEADRADSVAVITRRCQRLNSGSNPDRRISYNSSFREIVDPRPLQKLFSGLKGEPIYRHGRPDRTVDKFANMFHVSALYSFHR
jgi:hypothetical protein